MKIGLGTAAIGRPHYINVRQEANDYSTLEEFKRNGIALLEQAYHLGVRYFDTAPGYGVAEELLIEWLSEKKYRDVEVATKWGYTYVANFQKGAKVHEIKEHSLDKLKEQWVQSNKLLPYLTSYQIHSATLETGVLENKAVLDQLSRLKNEHGLIIGLSTTGANQQEVIERSLDVRIDNESLFDLYQVTYNVFDQNLRDIAQQLVADNKRVVVKEALANGRVFQNANSPKQVAMQVILTRLAEKYLVGIDAIALRFCMDSISPFKVLSGASTSDQLSQNLQSEAFRLLEAETEELYQFAVTPAEYWQERKLLAWN